MIRIIESVDNERRNKYAYFFSFSMRAFYVFTFHDLSLPHEGEPQAHHCGPEAPEIARFFLLAKSMVFKRIIKRKFKKKVRLPRQLVKDIYTTEHFSVFREKEKARK